MEKRRLGKTEHMSSILIFGSFALFRISQKAADAALEMALENGINHVDVSPLYGDAEKHLGSWFKRNGKKFFLGCKTHERRKVGAWESLKYSLDTLKVDSFDLFQLHGVDNAEVLDTVLGPGGAMEAILEAKKTGAGALYRYHRPQPPFAQCGAAPFRLRHRDVSLEPHPCRPPHRLE
jgi:aryl-alcohol dehydrogenase-like predicted oxidoreductase